MTLVISQPISRRLDRVVGDVCALLHDDTPAARQRALRWIAHVLQDACGRRKWWFLEKLVRTDLAPGQDVIDLRGDLDKVTAVFGPARLHKLGLAELAGLREAAIAAGTANAGPLSHYALEAGKRVHLWPAPAGTSAAFTADAGTDLLTLAGVSAPATGASARLSSGGSLPAPLAADTTYYLIRVDTSTVKVAATLAGALAGTAINLTDAGSGAHTLSTPVTPFAMLYTRPMDLAIVPDAWETIVLNGVLGLFGHHFDRDALTNKPEYFEKRYETQLRRAGTDSHDLERVSRWDAQLPAGSAVSALSGAGGAQSYTVPASLSGIGYVTLETGDYPLVVA